MYLECIYFFILSKRILNSLLLAIIVFHVPIRIFTSMFETNIFQYFTRYFFFLSLLSKSNFELIHFEILSKNFDSNRITTTPLIIVIQKGHESGVRVNAPLAKKVQKMGNDQHVKQFRRVRVFDDVTNAIPPPPSSS